MTAESISENNYDQKHEQEHEMKTISLPDGEPVPALGQGTWRMGEKKSTHAAEVGACCLGYMAKRDKRERLRTLRNIGADNFNRPLARGGLIDLHGFDIILVIKLQ